ncbi:hypothetical protein ScPMuIL_019011 [Solemya velum]
MKEGHKCDQCCVDVNIIESAMSKTKLRGSSSTHHHTGENTTQAKQDSEGRCQHINIQRKTQHRLDKVTIL